MRRIRNKYDECHKTVLSKQQEFETKKRELEQAKNDEANIEDEIFRKTSGLNNTKITLDYIKDEHEKQMLTQRSY